MGDDFLEVLPINLQTVPYVSNVIEGGDVLILFMWITLTLPSYEIRTTPTTSYIVWNLISAPKESLITPINEHWTSEATNYNQMIWLKGKIYLHRHLIFRQSMQKTTLLRQTSTGSEVSGSVFMMRMQNSLSAVCSR